MTEADPHRHPLGKVRNTIQKIIFEAETPAGKLFDVALIISILLSITVVMLDSIAPIRSAYGEVLRVLEWTITIGFTIEYGLRIFSIGQPRRYIISFFGIVDLLAILPTYLATLIETGDPEAANDAAFAGVDWADLESSWSEYIVRGK